MNKLNPARHSDHAWRVHTLAPDFELLDVWSVPIHADPARGESFARFLDVVLANGLAAGRATSALVELRRVLGRLFGWDRDVFTLPIPGCTERSIAERMTEADRRRSSVDPHRRTTPFTEVLMVYRFEDEALLEISNNTIHALVHFSWVDDDRSGKTARLAVYIKSRGIMSRIYMAMIEPFRNWIVYPAYTEHLAALWGEEVARSGGAGCAGLAA
jgi:hypothetical protein